MPQKNIHLDNILSMWQSNCGRVAHNSGLVRHGPVHYNGYTLMVSLYPDFIDVAVLLPAGKRIRIHSSDSLSYDDGVVFLRVVFDLLMNHVLDSYLSFFHPQCLALDTNRIQAVLRKRESSESHSTRRRL